VLCSSQQSKFDDALKVTYLYNALEMNETPIIPRSDCNEQGVCVCDVINSFRDSMENDDLPQLGDLSGGSSTTPTIRPNSDPTCGIDQFGEFTIDGNDFGFCSPIQGTLELYSPVLITGGIISIQGWASAITAGCITPMIIASMI
jgi:hypothetical protein